MELVNSTALAARLHAVQIDPSFPRVGSITAKATWKISDTGQLSLDSEDPLPVFTADEETDLGLLPRDDFPRNDPVFEVILLGHAYGLGGDELVRQTVRLSVGPEARELTVFGDREWSAPGEDGRAELPTEITPLERVPLTWRQAYGGKVDVLIDHDAPVVVASPLNSEGRGFNADAPAQHLAAVMSCPDGFPVVPPRGFLPNIESAGSLIQSWDDEPTPVCWATLPLNSGLHVLRGVNGAEFAEGADPRVTPGFNHRAHPDWVIDVPLGAAEVRLEGVCREGLLRFELPSMRVMGDYVCGAKEGMLELVPQMMILLADERRFTLTYRANFNFDFEEGAERVLRLRLEDGWYGSEGER